MKTGEGKTLVATLPCYLNALSGRGVHVVTVNDYLARRDSEWMGRLYRFFGLSTGVIVHGLTDRERQDAYRSDITYGQNNEFGFDYLRDNMKFRLQDYVQRELNYAIVDEVDSILIDEARTPLIISGPSDESTDHYYRVNQIIPSLLRDQDFTVDEKSRTVVMTDDGVEKMEKQLGVQNLYDPDNIETLHHVNQALRAHTLYRRDVRLRREGRRGPHRRRVHRPPHAGPPLVGRPAPGGRGQGGREDRGREPDPRHDHVPELLPHVQEARGHDRHRRHRGGGVREDLQARRRRHPHQQDRSSARTRRTSSTRPSARSSAPSCDEIEELHEKGQPVLVGTVSRREERGRLDPAQEARHPAQRPQREAARARGRDRRPGRPQGRDHHLHQHGRPRHRHRPRRQPRDDGQARGRARARACPIRRARAERGVPRAAGRSGRRGSPRPSSALKQQTAAEHEEVVALGGLHILGTERHESRRIDNQLRGRAGRQGDPGVVALLPLARGRPDAHLRVRAHPGAHGAAWA